MMNIARIVAIVPALVLAGCSSSAPERPSDNDPNVPFVELHGNVTPQGEACACEAGHTICSCLCGEPPHWVHTKCQ